MMYINGISALLPEIVEEYGCTLGRVTEPDYNDVISPGQIRRMSRIMRMGMWTAMNTLSDASLTSVDSIITATAHGAIEDTEKFLCSLNSETGTGSPTSFIQSTHNVIGGQIALAIGCNGYNMTYSQRGFTFESALLDARTLLQENSQQILCGATDELHPSIVHLMNNLGYKSETKSEGELFAFFVLADQPAPNTYGVLNEIWLEIFDQSKFETKTKEIIQNYSLDQNNTLVLCGDINDQIFIPENFEVRYLLEETGYLNIFSALAMYKACLILRESSYENILILRHDKDAYYRGLLIQKNN